MDQFGKLACLAAALLLGGAGAHAQSNPAGPAAPEAQTAIPIGAVLEGMADWSRTNAFADMVKQGRKFGKPDTPFDELAVLGPDGWPIEDFGVVVATGTEGLGGIGGVYTVSGTCSALPSITLISTSGEVRGVARNTAGTGFVAQVILKDDADQFFLSFRNTSGGIKDLKVMRPGYANDAEFTTVFLDHVKRFSCLRFMDWTFTNNSPITKWSERAQPNAARYTDVGGVPWEVCIDLCNAVGADMWLNVPHLADDDYARQLAKLVKARLNPSLKVYVEYSNEVWNFGFQQAAWNQQSAESEVAAGGSRLTFDGESNKFYWGWRRYAIRSKRIADIFRSEFGEPTPNGRVRPILAGQMSNTEVMRQGLAAIDALYGPPRFHFWAIAGAPYFGMDAADQNPALTVDQVIAALDAGARETPVTTFYEPQAALAKWYGLQFVAYEAGVDTFGPNNVAAKRAASHDPRMQAICERYLRDWYGHGFGLMNWYVGGATSWNTPFGSWGLTEDMADQSTPKIKAIDKVIGDGPQPLTAGWRAPCQIDARKFVGAPPDWETRDPYLRALGPGEFRDYLIAAPKAGKYAMSVTLAGLISDGVVEILVNGRPVQLLKVAEGSGADDWTNTGLLLVDLDAGMNVMRLRYVTGYCANVRLITIAPRG